MNDLMDNPKMAREIRMGAYHTLLNCIAGEDPKRQGLKETPKRAAKAFEFLTSGYDQNVDEIIGNAIFDEVYDEMVIVKDIDFYSLCEHHLLPFFGKCHVGYIPGDRIIGLSKIPRIVNMFAKRVQVQERLTNQIAKTLLQRLNPLGVAVVVEARHLCMEMRGIQKTGAVTMTNSMRGILLNDKNARQEFLMAMKG